MEEFIELGVDGLMTDKPSTLMEVIRERIVREYEMPPLDFIG